MLSNKIKTIDFLKSIAILSVLLYHISPGIYVGGIIGVDIFFVVTGYLTALSFSKNTSAVNFIINRLNRIYPTLCVLLLVSLIFILIFGFYNEIQNLVKYVISSTVLLTNFHLYNDSGYFSSSIDSNLLYHLWSVSIEFQIWVLFAILILIKYNFVFKFIAVMSFVLSVFYLHNNNTEMFYLNPICRFWEAYLGFEMYYCSKLKIIKKKYTDFFIIIYLVAIFYLTTINIKEYYVVWLLIPVFSSLILIVSNDSVLLDIKLWAFFSKRTYALYIWHVPIIVCITYYFNFYDYERLLLIIIFTFFISELSYRFIEKR